MNAVMPVKFEIKRDGIRPRVVATMSDGQVYGWGDAKTDRGAKTVLSREAKKYGLTVNGDTAN